MQFVPLFGSCGSRQFRPKRAKNGAPWETDSHAHVNPPKQVVHVPGGVKKYNVMVSLDGWVVVQDVASNKGLSCIETMDRISIYQYGLPSKYPSNRGCTNHQRSLKPR